MNVLNQVVEEQWASYNADCVEGVKGLPSNSIDFSIYSPPFDSLFTYSASERDMGNCDGDKSFAEHFSHLVPELLRVTKPGRNLSFHCMNLPTSITRDGVIGIRDFRGELIRAFTDAGWIYHSEVCIWKDPVMAMQRTKALGLLHKQIKKDSSMSRQGIADYLVTMRKPGKNESPVSHEHGLMHYAGMEPPDIDRDIWQKNYETHEWYRPDGYREIHKTDDKWPCRNPFEPGTDAATIWSIAVWQRYASPVWMDIDQGDTLQTIAEEADEKHLCALQLQVIARALELWSNPGDTILSPFSGIMSEGVQSIKMGRKFIGFELKPAYWNQGIINMGRAKAEMDEVKLFAE